MLKWRERLKKKCWGRAMHPSCTLHLMHSSFSETWLLPAWTICRAFIIIKISLHKNALLAKWGIAQIDENHSQWRVENALLYHNMCIHRSFLLNMEVNIGKMRVHFLSALTPVSLTLLPLSWPCLPSFPLPHVACGHYLHWLVYNSLAPLLLCCTQLHNPQSTVKLCLFA